MKYMITIMLLCFSVATYAESIKNTNNHKKDKQAITSIANLIERVTPNEPFTDMQMLRRLKSKQEYGQIAELYRLMGIALDFGYSLDHLIPYGLEKKQEIMYSIDLKKHPIWAPIDFLFLSLKNGVGKVSTTKLMRKGFTKDDIQKLDNYILLHNLEKLSLTNRLDFIYKNHSKIKSNIKQGKKTFDMDSYYQFWQGHQISQWENTRIWAVGMLELFNTYKQRLLISALMDRLGSITIMGTPHTDEEFQIKALKLTNGNVLSQLQILINKFNKEVK